MAAQQGTVYEDNSFKILKKHKLVVGSPAGGASNIPDLEIVRYGGNAASAAGLELKMTPTAAGGLVMQYINGKWVMGDTDGKEEKIFLSTLAHSEGVLALANSKTTTWGKAVPYLQYTAAGKKMYRGNLTERQAYTKDIKQYGGQNEIHVDVATNTVVKYYNTKDCYYMNVGTHGLYLLGKSDPLGLNVELKKAKAALIPVFNFPVHIRCRCQPKGGGSYNFNMVLTMKGAAKSPYNLLPSSAAGVISTSQFGKNENKTLLEAFGV